jgi:hypothetical protein
MVKEREKEEMNPSITVPTEAAHSDEDDNGGPAPIVFTSDFPSINHEEVYSKVRSKILTLGLKPTAIPHGEDDQNCNSFDDICTTYQEAYHCSGTGMNFCQMAFINDEGKYVIAETSGEGANTNVLISLKYATPDEIQEINNVLNPSASVSENVTSINE